MTYDIPAIKRTVQKVADLYASKGGGKIVNEVSGVRVETFPPDTIQLTITLKSSLPKSSDVAALRDQFVQAMKSLGYTRLIIRETNIMKIGNNSTTNEFEWTMLINKE